MSALLNPSNLPLEAIDFNSIKTSEFLPALDEAIKEAKANLEKVKAEASPNFENIIVAEETSADKLDRVVNIFYALYSAHCTDEISAIAEEFNQKLTAYSSDVSLDAKLFSQVKTIYDQKSELKLSKEQETLLENSYLNFTRNGALLSEDDKNKLREIDQKLSQLSLKFSENVRNATNAFTLWIEDEKDLAGMPEGVVEAAKEAAKSKGEEDKWAFTLHYPSYGPFMQYCQNRELRKKMYEASSSKGYDGEFDNKQIVLDTLRVRKERAKLLGYENHPSYILERRMAKTPQRVMEFIQDITHKAKPRAQAEFNQLKELKQELTGDSDLRAYDGALYTELLKKKVLDFDDEILRPYFKLENVLNGIFEVAKRLYGLNFKKREDLPKYHEDVMVYEVTSEKGEFVSLYYADYFPRTEKRPGAWMTVFRNAGLQFGEVKRPFVMNVCNFTKPTASKPSLLTLNEVLTLFHEFGHGLHGMLAKSTYKSIAGTNVLWDFVELPSQIMENWVLEKECLDLFAVHYKTGEAIPSELVEKIKKSQQFLEGMGTMRQMSFANVDMQWHLADPEALSDVQKFENEQMQEYQLYPKEGVGAFSTAFGHIFSGGYSAGYYSYKWAEVLDADAFAYFREKGIFSREVADRFRENILEQGGSQDPMELYIKFRGREPKTDALLERSGLA
ncbi:MAG: peptidase M3 [Halobacteriovoraceae bacterium]|nr:peptidase M3 [Halobacteriovoraceae bacterium]